MARKILLADDSVTAQNMGRRILTDAGYEVVTVNNGSAALKKIAEHKPDLLVLDVYMPGYGGLEVCQRLKENKDTARIPVLLTVGKLEPFKADEARRVRADAYIVKPFEASELLTALTKLEDKIVPGPESYKPGRFAKAVADLEQSTPSPDEVGLKDSGWNERLVIPRIKREKKESKEQESAATKGSRLFGRRKSDRAGAAENPASTIPADITPEEISAITAAAAVLTGEKRPTEANEEKAPAEEMKDVSAGREAEAESSSTPMTFATAPMNEPSPAGIEINAAPQVAPEAAKEGADEGSREVAPAASAQQAAPVAEPEPASAVVGQQTVETPAEALRSEASHAEAPISSAEGQVVSSSTVAEGAKAEKPSDAEVLAALAMLGGPADLGQAATAAFAGPGEIHGQASGPRWIAEEIALGEEERSLILEREMEKTYAAFAAADHALSMGGDAGVAVLPTPVSEEAPVSSIAAMRDVLPPPETARTDAPFEVSGAGPQQFEGRTEPSGAADGETIPPATAEGSAFAQPVAADAVAAESSTIPAEAPAPAEGEAAYAAAASATGSALAGGHGEADSVPENRVSQSMEEGGRGEAELAAAWANWRHIRESLVGTENAVPANGDQVSGEPTQEATPQPEAAASSSTEAPSQAADQSQIASIVDNMLAELKPKLMEEIARKLASEKK